MHPSPSARTFKLVNAPLERLLRLCAVLLRAACFEIARNDLRLSPVQLALQVVAHRGNLFSKVFV